MTLIENFHFRIFDFGKKKDTIINAIYTSISNIAYNFIQILLILPMCAPSLRFHLLVEQSRLPHLVLKGKTNDTIMTNFDAN